MATNEKFSVLTEEELSELLASCTRFCLTGVPYTKPKPLNEFQAVVKITGGK